MNAKKDRRKFIMGGFKVKHDCFAFKKELRKCNACNELYCLTEKCPFYKTEFERCTECKATRTQITCQECKAKGLK